MPTLKERYEGLRKETIEKFYGLLQKRVDDYNKETNENHPFHYYKDSIKDLEYGDSSISFSFLPYKIVLRYEIDLKADIAVYAHRQVIDHNNYPNFKLEPIPALNFDITVTRNIKKDHEIIHAGEKYSVGDNESYCKFFDLYIKKLERTFFPE